VESGRVIEHKMHPIHKYRPKFITDVLYLQDGFRNDEISNKLSV